MWKVSRIQGFKNKWAVSFNGALKGFVNINEEGKVSGKIQLADAQDTFEAIDHIQELIGDDMAEEQLLMSL
jgi:hypothetical protein